MVENLAARPEAKNRYPSDMISHPKLMDIAHKNNGHEISKIVARFRVLRPFRLPEFTGSAIHGLLGRALAGVHYGDRSDCSGCTVRPECRYGSLYAYLFESPADHPLIFHHALPSFTNQRNYPQPLIVDLPDGRSYTGGEHFQFAVTLVGNAIRHFPFVVCALIRMENFPVGGQDKALLLETIMDENPGDHGDGSVVYDGKTNRVIGSPRKTDLSVDILKQLTESIKKTQELETNLTFLTPFRYKVDSKLGVSLNFEILVRSAMRRLLLLSVHWPNPFVIDAQPLVSAAGQVERISSTLRWLDPDRYSNRQRSWMKLGGFVGDISFKGRLAPFLPYLEACKRVHLGKGGTFGLGQYQFTYTAAP